jgi:hypothetical protein
LDDTETVKVLKLESNMPEEGFSTARAAAFARCEREEKGSARFGRNDRARHGPQRCRARAWCSIHISGIHIISSNQRRAYSLVENTDWMRLTVAGGGD